MEQVAINIPEIIYDQIMHWVNKADYEVSGFCKCEYKRETNSIEVLSAHLIKQEGRATETDIDAEALAKLMFTTRALPGELKLWWHSHVKMPAFWSGTDTKTIEDLGANGWIAAIVFNQNYEYKAAYCGLVQNPFGVVDKMLVDDLDMNIIYPLQSEAIIQAWDKEFTENVTKYEYKYAGSGYQGSFPTYGKVGDPAWDRDDYISSVYSDTPYEKGSSHKDLQIHRAYEEYNKSILTASEADLMKDDYLTVAEEARVLGLSEKRWRRLLDKGDPKVLDGYYEIINDHLAEQELIQGVRNGVNFKA